MLRQFMSYIIASAYADDNSTPVAGRPQSCFLIAEPGMGKTESLERFKVTQGLEFFSDITVKQLIPVLRRAARHETTHLVLTEFQKIIARRREVAANFLALMLQSMEEGVGRIGMGPHHYDLQGARLGLLAASTLTSIRKYPFMIEELAMDSRMFLIDARLDGHAVDLLQKMIAEGDRSLLTPVKLKLPDKPVTVTMTTKLAHEIRPWVKEIQATGNRTYGVRTYVRFLRTLYGVALINGRRRVTSADVAELYQFRRYWLDLPDISALYATADGDTTE